MRLCSYVVKNDKGFAPNPFGGWCTLAACTPNHQGLRLKAGDWVVGHSSAAAKHRLIYAMRVSEVLDFDDYYRDPRFAAKKAQAGGWKDRCGDNIYFRDRTGQWRRGLAFYHTQPDDIHRDTRYPRVFISNHFFYFGADAPPFPDRYSALIQTRQGCTCRHKPTTAQAFVKWLENTYSPGRHGEPRDRDTLGSVPVGLGSRSASPARSRTAQRNGGSAAAPHGVGRRRRNGRPCSKEQRGM
jgi:hypothetical protein